MENLQHKSVGNEPVNVSEIIARSNFNKFFVGIFAINFLVAIFNGYSQGVYGAALPVLMQDTGIGAEVFGLIGSYTLYGMIFGGIAFGMLADKVGRKVVLMIGIAFFSIGTGLFGIASTPFQFGLFRVIAGIGLAGTAPVIVAIVSEYSTQKERSNLVTITTMGVPVGTMLSALLGIFILPTFGWKAMYFTGFICLAMLVVVWMFLPESMDRLVARKEKEKVQKILKKANPLFTYSADEEFTTQGLMGAKNKKASLVNLFQGGFAKNTILFWIIFATYMFSIYGIATWLPKLMINAGYPLGGGLWFLFSFSLGALPGNILSGTISNRIGFKKAIIAYSLIAASTILALTIKTTTSILAVELFVGGFGMYGGMGLIYTYIASNYPNFFRGTGLGWASAMGRFGGSFGPMIGGILIARNASVTMSFVSFAVPLFVACIATFLSKDNTVKS